MPIVKIGLYFPDEMKLREHPSVKPHWPPQWFPYYGPRVPVFGEIGILEDIRVSSVTPKRCLLLMRNGQQQCIGEVQFDDETSCQWFIKLVEPHRGKSMAQIGNLDIA